MTCISAFTKIENEACYVVNDSSNWESNRFFLCYENRFVDITFDWTVTEEQKGIVALILG